jgi:LysR family transcriptional activator of nhaA
LIRESDAIALVPPIVVRDELDSKMLTELCRVPQLTESYYAIFQSRRFPNALLGGLLARYGERSLNRLG